MDNNQRIAIVGLGGVFPGAADIDGYWENILAARDCAREPPPGRWSLPLADVYSAGGPRPDRVYSKRACFVDGFEPRLEGLQIAPEFLAELDPMFTLLLHAGNEAWQDSVTAGLDRARVGVIIGNLVLPTDASAALADEILLPVFEKQLLGKAAATRPVNKLNRYVAGLPGGMLARALGLGGGAWTLDAACASSLYALKYALDELQSGRRDAMLCGGVSRPDSLYTQMGFSALHAISASGRCSPFDKKGDGLVVGEGAGILVLKRLHDALADGDHIYATVDGVGLSNDIEGNLMSPDSEGQLRAMRAAYRQAGWAASDVDLIECHGTGTPVGDVVEFNSLCALWGDARNEKDCVIGSVKSNIGHLLTAAGSAGLIKVLLALRHQKLPPTANYESATDAIDIGSSPFTVLDRSRDWPQRAVATPRRAAISAFGFGGINAHVLLQEWDEGNTLSPALPAPRADTRTEEIAIIGMDACFGPWTDLGAFRKRVLGDTSEAPARLDNNWGLDSSVDGYALGKVRVPLGRFRIPPNELKEMLPQQLLMLQVAANAIADAGIDGEKISTLKNAAVFIGIGLDLNTTNFHLRWQLLPKAREWARTLGLELSEVELRNWVRSLRDASGPAMNANRTMGALGGIVASRIARAFNIGGPAFTVSSEQSSGLRSLEAGIRALQRGEVTSAIVGAVDLASDVRALGDLPQTRDGLVGEGAAALILKRRDDALRDGDRIYALVRGVGAASDTAMQDGPAGSAHIQQAIERSCADAHIDLDSVGLVVGSGTAAGRGANGLESLFALRTTAIPCALGDVAADIGDSGAAATLAALVKTALCLYHRVLPASRGSDSPQQGRDTMRGLFAAGATQYWLRDRLSGPRRALVNAASVDGNYISAVLEDDERANTEVRVIPAGSGEALFSVCADEKYALIDALQGLRAIAAASADMEIHALARQWWQQAAASQAAARAVSVIARDAGELALLLKQAQGHVERDASITSDRLYYAAEPLAAAGKVAFVFPGSGSHFIGMGREMSVRWPAALEGLDAENRALASQFGSARFWTAEDTSGFTHEDFIFGQVWLGAMVSDVIAGFGIKPDAVIGYCLGESVGLFATRTWRDRDLMLERIRATRLFSHDLGGTCDAARQVWGEHGDAVIDWQLGVVDRPAETVREALTGRSRVYLLIINTPGECVIGGERAAVQAVVRDLGCGFHPLEGVTTVHCEVVKPVEQAYRELHLFETTPPAGVDFYSGVKAGRYTVTTDSAADSIVRQALQTFDNTKLVNAAYDDGVRVFIEMGPGASCSRMIGQILGQRRHIARSACVKGQSDVANVLRILAQLNAERVPVDLASLYVDSSRVDAFCGHTHIAVDVGRPAFQVPLPPRRTQTRDERAGSAVQPSAASAKVMTHPAVAADSDPMAQIVAQMQVVAEANAEAQASFLKVANGINASLAEAIATQVQLLQAAPGITIPPATERQVAFERVMCMEFATGSIAKMLGPQFATVDQHPTRVRLPDEPLMLVDRIIKVEGEACSMGNGRVVTEHDVLPGAWYLDGGRIPTCIAVEAGQADLFLSGYLGIDLKTRGHAVYRLLDAEVCFHGPLPEAGQCIRYDIYIDHFFRQGDTWLFRFGFDGTVDGQPLITMRNGCAGFFTQAELDAGRGIVRTALETRPLAGTRANDWQDPVPMQQESYNDAQIDALRAGDLAHCFGGKFAKLALSHPAGLPGGRMTLVHRILALEPGGGRFGLGMITGEADIHPDDWFLTCHFVDDQVMPGTLMYECCLHTLRVYLLRMGWVGEAGTFVYEPVVGVSSKLKCRGQVLASTRKVQYEISIREIGYAENGDTPYVIADALMYADGKAIVQMSNMSLQLSGLTRQRIVDTWTSARAGTPVLTGGPVAALFDYASINAFAVGRPSDAFGERYRVFDEQRVIARLPGPPFQFLDRIISIKDCEPWQLKAGALIEGQYDIPPDAWYFAADRQQTMPFAVLLEVALQPCGWLAAYLGSALTSEVDLSFRNLGGTANQYRAVGPDSGTLTTRIKLTNVALSGGMIIQNYDMEVRDAVGPVYVGDTYFGFFPRAALADQVGIRDAEPWVPDATAAAGALQFPYPQEPPFPDTQMRMVHEIDCFDAAGGPEGLGFIRGSADVDVKAWFFKAHFYQDPVWPGSLGLESFMQLLKVVAERRWPAAGDAAFQCMALGQKHSWVYRGQIIPADRQVRVQAVITAIDDDAHWLKADGFLSVDGRIIYQMTDFALKMTAS